MEDIFSAGTPKYSTPQSIYDALCDLVQTEEASILGEMGADVSWDNQTYYYTEKGSKLKDKFEEITDCCNKMWILDLAIFQIDENAEIHDIIFMALTDPDLAKRIGFKKLFIEILLRDCKDKYDLISSELLREIEELPRFDYWGMAAAFSKVVRENNFYLPSHPEQYYSSFCYHLATKARNLQLSEEVKLVAECRALLTSYDDFLYGLRMNQALYNTLENQYKDKVIQLESTYKNKLNTLIEFIKSKGFMGEISDGEVLKIEGKVLEEAN